MFDRILVPVDGSNAASAALDHALEIADDRDADLICLYIADTSEPSQTRVGTNVVDVLEQEGDDVVADAKDRAEAHGRSVTTDVVQGVPHDTIVDYVDHYDVDLVVMGTHGRDGLERYVLGSVAERVVNASPVPVVTVRDADETTTTYPYESVLVPTDGSDHAAAALRRAAAVAARHGATVHLLTVVDESILGGADDRTDRARELLAEAETTARDAGVDDVVTEVRSGSVPREIVSYADDEGVDLVVMGTHGRNGLDQLLLGSITERVLRTASVPVLTTTEADDS
ncbi:UspA domain-containing protein [Haloterrigena salina JCM 13891]|uniref:UspA domain-containing protein n=1 Tax=Haloterrigena salina JCM 13891 TaxID=1227488 RepID=M0BTD2_9EURY|nr:universal stress protein [Haloterrigena salina]ELZ13372.1 UspA domain-containing protein [Haloterrigena salina JCM 13891]